MVKVFFTYCFLDPKLCILNVSEYSRSPSTWILLGAVSSPAQHSLQFPNSRLGKTHQRGTQVSLKLEIFTK